ncbi:MAG TPA: hypothetical protein VLZ74_02960 [Methylocella sp.]|nr:hypothetical protein [Methylocella sp.]
MKSIYLEARALGFKIAVLAGALLLLSPQVQADPGPEGPFSNLSGSWFGSGIINLTNGAAERIRCRASYAVNPAGRAAQQTLRCASASYQLAISSNVISQGGSLSGSWSEATHGVSGSISGRAIGSEIVANVWGGSFAARFTVRTHGNTQSVTIRPEGGTDVAAVSIVLHRG